MARIATVVFSLFFCVSASAGTLADDLKQGRAHISLHDLPVYIVYQSHTTWEWAGGEPQAAIPTTDTYSIAPFWYIGPFFRKLKTATGDKFESECRVRYNSTNFDADLQEVMKIPKGLIVSYTRPYSEKIDKRFIPSVLISFRPEYEAPQVNPASVTESEDVETYLDGPGIGSDAQPTVLGTFRVNRVEFVADVGPRGHLSFECSAKVPSLDRSTDLRFTEDRLRRIIGIRSIVQ